MIESKSYKKSYPAKARTIESIISSHVHKHPCMLYLCPKSEPHPLNTYLIWKGVVSSETKEGCLSTCVMVIIEYMIDTRWLLRGHETHDCSLEVAMSKS